MSERGLMNVKRIIQAWVIVAFGGFALYCVACVVRLMPPDTDALRVRLLYETDHAVLLETCRDLSRRAIAGELRPRTYQIKGKPDPETATFGPPILELEPAYVAVDESGVIMVAMIGGLDHIGVHAYPESYPRSDCAMRGDRELIAGLWYYDDGYEERPRDWDRHIEKLRRKAKSPQPETP